jgi:6-phosphogluconate dehydrogenase (decarboxylating)
MKLAMADLGKMGPNMVRRRVRDGHEVAAACDLDSAATPSLTREFDGHRIKPAGEPES